DQLLIINYQLSIINFTQNFLRAKTGAKKSIIKNAFRFKKFCTYRSSGLGHRHDKASRAK
ncbi:MAG: hypothetical protein DRR16_33565, partial [Candidatus Parabeggiatoa sp. nov. 3]